SSAMLMLLSGAVEERTRTRSIRALGGLAELMPRLAGFWLFAVLTLVGVPLLAGFVAEFMLFTGAFPAHRIATVMVMATMVLAIAGLLWAAHRVFYGPARETFARARDATTLELTYLIPLVAAVLFVGIRAGALTPVISDGVGLVVWGGGLSADRFSMFITIAACGFALVTCLLSDTYLRVNPRRAGAFFALILLTTAATSALASEHEMVTFFVAFELLVV